MRAFDTKGSSVVYEKDDRRFLPQDKVERIRGILAALDTARTIADMDRPSLRLHPLKGELKGFWSVTVRANWRIIFRFEDGSAFDVDLVDYH